MTPTHLDMAVGAYFGGMRTWGDWYITFAEMQSWVRALYPHERTDTPIFSGHLGSLPVTSIAQSVGLSMCRWEPVRRGDYISLAGGRVLDSSSALLLKVRRYVTCPDCLVTLDNILEGATR